MHSYFILLVVFVAVVCFLFFFFLFFFCFQFLGRQIFEFNLIFTAQKKWSFLLSIFSVNMTKFTRNFFVEAELILCVTAFYHFLHFFLSIFYRIGNKWIFECDNDWKRGWSSCCLTFDNGGLLLQKNIEWWKKMEK